jgi:type I restriction enzyme S subunit
MAQPKLNQRMLNSIPVPFPDFETQSEVVSQLDVLKEEIQNIALCYKKKIVSLEELKKSLIQKAFSGELTKNFNEEVKDLVAS